ncbi:unnamed protein product, partial [Ascophyllum nodosum]
RKRALLTQSTVREDFAEKSARRTCCNSGEPRRDPRSNGAVERA